MTAAWRKKGSGPRAEKALVRALLAGDEAAFDTLVEEYVPPIYRYALRRTGDRETARDLTQTTICKVIAKLPGFRGEAGLGTWLFACCRNEIAMHFRRRSSAGIEVPWAPTEARGDEPSGVPMVPCSADGPEESFLRGERTALVHQALDQLPGHYGRALEWKYIEGLPVREIARRLELGEKAAESLLTRAREAFRGGYRRLVDGAPDGSGHAPAAALLRTTS